METELEIDMETEIKNDTEARAKELYRLLKSCQADIQQMVLDNANRRWEAKVAGIRGRKHAARIIGKFAAWPRCRTCGCDIYQR